MPLTPQILTLVLVLVLCTGCATPQIALMGSNVPPVAVETVAAKSIAIEDLTVPAPVESPSSWVYRTGWMPIPPSWMTPPFADVFVADLREGVRADGTGSPLSITVLEVGYFVDKTASDDVAFVGLVRAGRDRAYLCRATVSLKQGERSRKEVVEVQEVRNRHISDLDAAQAQKLTLDCKAKLLTQMRVRVREFLKAA